MILPGVCVLESSISSFLCFCGVGIHSHKTWDEQEVIEYFTWLPFALAIRLVSILPTVWATVEVLVLSSETATTIDTTVISLGFKTRKKLYPRLANIDCRNALVGKCK